MTESGTLDVWGVPLSDVVHSPNPVLARSAERVAQEAEQRVEASSGFGSAIGPDEFGVG